MHVMKHKKILPRDKIDQILDPETEKLELSKQAGLGQEYGSVPGGSSISGELRIETSNSA